MANVKIYRILLDKEGREKHSATRQPLTLLSQTECKTRNDRKASESNYAETDFAAKEETHFRTSFGKGGFVVWTHL